LRRIEGRGIRRGPFSLRAAGYFHESNPMQEQA